MKNGIRAEGIIFSCSSVGIKVGGGLASAISGWVLVAVRYNAGLEVQAAATQTGITAGYLVIPAIVSVLLAIIISQVKVIQENQQLLSEKNVSGGKLNGK